MLKIISLAHALLGLVPMLWIAPLAIAACKFFSVIFELSFAVPYIPATRLLRLRLLLNNLDLASSSRSLLNRRC